MVRPRFASRSPLAVESLERRDCPAAVAVLGGGTIAEGGDSTVLTVRLSAPDTKAVQVGYIISGDGTRPAVVAADYRLTIGTQALAGPSGTIEFKPGETVKQIRVTAIDDALREGTESLRFKLFRPLGCTIDAASASVVVTARDNDDYTAALVPQGTSRIAEGASAPFVLELSKPATKAETFYVSTQNGSATTADYRPLRDMPVTILAGQSRSQPFSISTLKDADATETDEYFLLTARARSTDSPAIDPIGVTIIGARPATVALTVTDAAVKEGNAGFATGTFTVRLNAPALDPITVQYTTAPGTATSGVDYVAAQGSLVFARGQISKTVTVNVIGDTVVEGNETFQFVATATGGATASATGTGTILDDDTNFQIDLRFVDSPLGSVPATVQALARKAADRWSQIIVGDLPNVTLPGGVVIDDFQLTVQMGLLGGAANTPGGMIANAGPTAFRPGSAGLPYQGEAGLDPGDVLNLSSPAQQQWVIDVITHELGHALGFGSGFKPFDPFVVGDAFNGPNALREYRTAASNTASTIPLEPGVRGHWDEKVFGNELMTPFAAAVGTAMPISRVTIGALQDMGYSVNYAAADSFVVPTAAVRSVAGLPVAATSATQRMFALMASSTPDLLAAAMTQMATGANSPATPRQRAVAFGGVRA